MRQPNVLFLYLKPESEKTICTHKSFKEQNMLCSFVSIYLIIGT